VIVTRRDVIIALEIARELSLKARDGRPHTHMKVTHLVKKWKPTYRRIHRIISWSGADYELNV
jgi:hypothetical protein